MKENCVCEELKENVRPYERKKPEIHVKWMDNGQLMFEGFCYPEEYEDLEELIRFVKNLVVDT